MILDVLPQKSDFRRYSAKIVMFPMLVEFYCLPPGLGHMMNKEALFFKNAVQWRRSKSDDSLKNGPNLTKSFEFEFLVFKNFVYFSLQKTPHAKISAQMLAKTSIYPFS